MSTLALELLSSAVHGRVTLEKSRYDLTRLRDQYDGKSFDAAGLKFTWDIGSNTHQIKIDDLFYAWLSLSSSDDVETRDDNRFNLAVADCISTVNHSRQFKDPSDISREELIDAVEQIKKMAKQLHVLLARLPKSVELNGIVFRLKEIKKALVTYEGYDEQQFQLDLINNEIFFDGFRQDTEGSGLNTYSFSNTKNPKSVFESVKKFMDKYHIRSDIRKIDRVLVGIGDKYEGSNHKLERVKLSLFAPKEKLDAFFDEVEQLAHKHSFEIAKGR